MKYILNLILLLPIVLILLSLLPHKAKDIKKGNKLFSQQKYDEALKQYAKVEKKDTDSDIVNFNMGAALYKKGEFEKILAHFKKALLTEDKKLKEKTHYNLGNVFYKIGMSKKDKDLKSTVELLEQSLAEYAKALKLNKDNEDAKYNYAYVKNLLDKIKEQLQNQPQQKQQKNQSKLPSKQPKPQIRPPQPKVKPPQPNSTLLVFTVASKLTFWA